MPSTVEAEMRSQVGGHRQGYPGRMPSPVEAETGSQTMEVLRPGRGNLSPFLTINPWVENFPPSDNLHMGGKLSTF